MASEIKIEQRKGWQAFTIDGVIVASIEPRPYYCDRGHWIVKMFGVPDLDSADGFPRYYMSETTAKLETISFLNWRLWRIRSS